LDLIRKLAILEGESNIDNPEHWFKEKYNEEPRYSLLIEKVAPYPIARKILLQQYIEPTDEQREKGLRVPSPSHKAIARLVKNRVIRVILTTNFDQLLESALREVGVTPSVIFSDDSFDGAMPFVHSECTIVKLHGDYVDTRIKNTPDELARYSEKMNAYLDRIFDEHGLIIVGWSADWDAALRDALFRRHNWRFSTYWVYRKNLSTEATRLQEHLRAIPLQIETADKLFQKLSDNIEALRTYERPHPLSVPLAVAQVKKYVAEDKYRIQLHDLIHEIVEKSSSECYSERFKTTGILLTEENYFEIIQNRLKKYEQLMELPIASLSTLVYFDTGFHSDEITKAIEKTIQTPDREGSGHLLKLQYYPSLLLSYSLGITSLESKNYQALAALLLKPSVYDFDEKKTAIKYLVPWKVASTLAIKSLDIPDPDTRKTAFSDYLCKLLSEPLNPYFSNSKIYEEKFDIYEYLLGLVFLDQNFEDFEQKERIEAPTGRFRWKYSYLHQMDDNIYPIERFFTSGLHEGDNWGLLKAGFFGGSPDRLKYCIKAFEAYLKEKYHSYVMNFLGQS
jgi:hypothetical protein